MLQLIIKVADLGHLSHPMPLHRVNTCTQHSTLVMQCRPHKQLQLAWHEVAEIMFDAAKRLHTCQVLALHMQRWLQGLEEEFFTQGDFEADLGLPITPFMDRALPGISSKQVRGLRSFS